MSSPKQPSSQTPSQPKSKLWTPAELDNVYARHEAGEDFDTIRKKTPVKADPKLHNISSSAPSSTTKTADRHSKQRSVSGTDNADLEATQTANQESICTTPNTVGSGAGGKPGSLKRQVSAVQQSPNKKVRLTGGDQRIDDEHDASKMPVRVQPKRTTVSLIPNYNLLQRSEMFNIEEPTDVTAEMPKVQKIVKLPFKASSSGALPQRTRRAASLDSQVWEPPTEHEPRSAARMKMRSSKGHDEGDVPSNNPGDVSSASKIRRPRMMDLEIPEPSFAQPIKESRTRKSLQGASKVAPPKAAIANEVGQPQVNEKGPEKKLDALGMLADGQLRKTRERVSRVDQTIRYPSYNTSQQTRQESWLDAALEPMTTQRRSKFPPPFPDGIDQGLSTREPTTDHQEDLERLNSASTPTPRHNSILSSATHPSTSQDSPESEENIDQTAVILNIDSDLSNSEFIFSLRAIIKAKKDAERRRASSEAQKRCYENAVADLERKDQCIADFRQKVVDLENSYTQLRNEQEKRATDLEEVGKSRDALRNEAQKYVGELDEERKRHSRELEVERKKHAKEQEKHANELEEMRKARDALEQEKKDYVGDLSKEKQRHARELEVERKKHAEEQEKHANELEEMRKARDTLEQEKKENVGKLDKEKQCHARELEVERKKHAEEIVDQQLKHEVELITKPSQDILDNERQTHQKEIDEKRKKHQKEIDEERKKHKEELIKGLEMYNGQLEEEKKKHAQELERHKEHVRELESEKEKHVEDLNEEKKKHSNEIAGFQQGHSRALQECSDARKSLEHKQTQLRNRLARMTENHQNSVKNYKDLKRSFDDSLDVEIRKTELALLAEWTEKLENEQQQHEISMNGLHGKLEEQQNLYTRCEAHVKCTISDLEMKEKQLRRSEAEVQDLQKKVEVLARKPQHDQSTQSDFPNNYDRLNALRDGILRLVGLIRELGSGLEPSIAEVTLLHDKLNQDEAPMKLVKSVVSVAMHGLDDTKATKERMNKEMDHMKGQVAACLDTEGYQKKIDYGNTSSQLNPLHPQKFQGKVTRIFTLGR
ncbi:MAG: hypothetical protein Q9219_003148 [cf. Caloplaca sp. 3 TL-2023]